MTKKTLLILAVIMMVANLALVACGGADTPTAPAAPAGKPDYVPTGETAHFSRIDDADPVTVGDQLFS